jgi:hypothetical protein
MQPKIIKKDRLYITGLTGDGAKTGEVWNDFARRYNVNPFPKADEAGHEIRFGESVHVGFQTASAAEGGEYSFVELPATEYAVFDVFVAKGYDSENDAMNQWLADNAAIYRQRELDGRLYVVESYNEKFKGGSAPDSMVEIWIPLFRFCQSCYMPMTTKLNTTLDG